MRRGTSPAGPAVAAGFVECQHPHRQDLREEPLRLWPPRMRHKHPCDGLDRMYITPRPAGHESIAGHSTYSLKWNLVRGRHYGLRTKSFAIQGRVAIGLKSRSGGELSV